MSNDADGNGDIVGTICATLTSVFRFVKFTTSRWLTVGTSARTVIASLLLGVEDLARFIEHDTKSSLFYIKGFSRLTDTRKQFLAQAAMISRVSEGFQAVLMDDSRVAVIYDDLWAAATDEVKWLISVSDSVWSAMGGICKWTGDFLKDKCIMGGHISYHFLWRRVLAPASELPWTLCRGDIVANLQELAAGNCPEEPIASQLWQLMQIDFPVGQLQATVKLLGEVGWTSLPAEQQHGSLAQVRRWHPEYGVDSLTSRALLMSVSRLLPSQSAEERRIGVIMRQLEKMDKSNPDKASGRQGMLQSMIAIARRTRAETPNNANSAALSKHCFHRHAAIWAKLTLRDQSRWNQRAGRDAIHKKQAVVDHIKALSNDLELQRERLATNEQHGPPLCMSACALEDRYLGQFEDLCTLPGFRHHNDIEAARKASRKPPFPWSKEYVKELAEYKTWTYNDPAQPPFTLALAKIRDCLVDSALVVRRADGRDEFFKFIYGVQAPRGYLALCPLREVDLGPPSWEPGASMWVQIEQHVARKFTCNYAELCTAADLKVDNMFQLWLLLGITHRGGTSVTTQCQPMSLRPLMLGDDTVGEEEGGAADKEAVVKDKHHEELICAYPWLATLDMATGFGTGDDCASVKKRRTAQKHMDPEDPVELDDDTALGALKDMERARAALEEEGGIAPADIDFALIVRGGAEEKVKTGDAAHAHQAVARTTIAKDWCKVYKLQNSFKATFSANGGPDTCAALCRGWIHKMQFFLNMYIMSDTPDELYGLGHAADYREPTEITRLRVSVLGNIAVRIAVIDRIPLG